jgi:PAS domain S-box-containing protein
VPRFEESADDLFEHAPCGYLSAAPDGTIARVNETFLRLTGHRREALVGAKRFQELLTVGGRIYYETHYAPLLRMQGAVREIAVDLVAADGSRLPVLVNSILVRDAEGEPQAIRTIVLDARERKSYERELMVARDRERLAREQTERLQRITAVVAAAPDARSIGAGVIGELAALGAEHAGIAMLDQETAELRVIARRGPAGGGPGAMPAEVEFGEREARLPLAGASGVAGVLWLAFAEPRELDAGERAFLLACAAQTALALERGRLYEQTRDVASSLQRSMLAGEPPRDPRFEIATRYLPAVEHLEVGGDWHDAFVLPGDRIGIVVGDVVGRGLGAASAMGQLRSAVRALAGADRRPGEVLAHLDTFVEEVEPARFATLAYAEVDPDSGEVTMASAGHMPPVLFGAGEPPRLYMGGRSTPLGIPLADGARPDATFSLAPGAGFLLYTDGLVERRTEAIDAGFDRLLAAIAAMPDPAPDDLTRALPDTLVEHGAAGDDVCLLGFRFSGGG